MDSTIFQQFYPLTPDFSGPQKNYNKHYRSFVALKIRGFVGLTIFKKGLHVVIATAVALVISRKGGVTQG